jgi:adenine-specific DNA-methyltransferase
MQLARFLPSVACQVILDPACGDAALLSAVKSVLDDSETLMLIGADIDPVALQHARERDLPRAEYINVDSVGPRDGKKPLKTWRQLLKRRNVTGIIANPPWGAELSHSRTQLKEFGYRLAVGQFDSFDIFVELSLGIAPAGAALAFILPDSLFMPEHEPLRRLLLQHTDLKLIARLGEGFFPGVYRGCAVVILRNQPADINSLVECFRLPREWRQAVLAGTELFARAQAAFTHLIPQERFATDEMSRFDIDLQESDTAVTRIVTQPMMPWTRWLQTGRGVEISKHGRIIVCPHCGFAIPQPNDLHNLTCNSCKQHFSSSDARSARIVRRLNTVSQSDMDLGTNWHPLIVGEDVDRYYCHPSREIRAGVHGINYKNLDLPIGRKLLVRKTGVGLKAAINESECLTNQVVFHYYVPRGQVAPPFLLDYVQGVLCSRVLYAYYLKRLGENEWRSHPYITQKIIGSLPIPDVSEGSWSWRQATAIADSARERQNMSITDHDNDVDLLIECLVAGLFGLTTPDCEWVMKVLDEAEPLEPVRTLHLSVGKVILPLRVD